MTGQQESVKPSTHRVADRSYLI